MADNLQPVFKMTVFGDNIYHSLLKGAYETDLFGVAFDDTNPKVPRNDHEHKDIEFNGKLGRNMRACEHPSETDIAVQKAKRKAASKKFTSDLDAQIPNLKETYYYRLINGEIYD